MSDKFIAEKTIGILGGMGSYATCDIFRRILDRYPVEKEWERPRILIDNRCTMPSRVRSILYDENTDALVRQMSESVKWLVEAGAERIIIGCMTAHYFLERLPHQDKIINALELTAEYIGKTILQGERILVLCTEGSMKTGIWEKALASYNVFYPKEEEIRRCIETVKQNGVNDEERRRFSKYIEHFTEQHILLGCTELPLLMSRYKTGKNVIDPISIVIDSL